ncbi:MAG: hypothetical protein CVV42_15945 [Candidatus Riflebacteria bacterium HGW-Riflebacteria-2]|nr:MAG: hypothetical protein CVV42_15945 [Candidatus Riflebacteria bacterium HGW-Riflebacteria-2]
MSFLQLCFNEMWLIIGDNINSKKELSSYCKRISGRDYELKPSYMVVEANSSQYFKNLAGAESKIVRSSFFM